MSKQILPIDPGQAEKLSELGYRLHQSRQQQQIPLERVAAQTLIPTRTLAAIEAGNLAQLPEPVYVQGFIKRYGDAIGMNGTELANSFPAQAPLRSYRTSWRGTVQAQLRPLHLYLIYMTLVVSAISGLSYLMHRSTPQLASSVTNPNPNQPMPSMIPGLQNGPFLPVQKAATTIPGTVLSQPVAPSNPAKSVRVGLTVTAQSWIRVVADGKTEFEGVLTEGAQQTWEANKQLTLRAGNAGGIMVSLNNGQAKPLGTPGSVEEVTFGTNAQTVTSSQAATDTTSLASR